MDWHGLLRSHIPQAWQLLRRLLAGPTRLTPIEHGYRFEARITLGRILLGMVNLTSVASPTGLEPVLAHEDVRLRCRSGPRLVQAAEESLQQRA